MRVGLTLLLAALLTLGHADSARAEKSRDRLWPSVIIDTPIKNPDGIWVKPEKTITTLSQRETGLAQLSQDFVAPKSGKTVLAAETLHSFKHKVTILCTDTDTVKNKKGSIQDILRYCFMDDNVDGVLDRYFVPKNHSVTSLYHYVVLPNEKKMENISHLNIKMTPLDDRILKHERHLVLLDYGPLSSALQFRICDNEYIDDYGALYSMNNCIMPWFKIDEKSIPIEITLLGARFLLQEKRGPEILIVQLDPIKYDLYSNMR